MAACSWTLDTSCCADWDTFTPEIQETATAWASELLDALTGRQFGQCPVVVRPCGKRCGWFGGYLTYPVDSAQSSGLGAPWMVPYIGSGGVWRNCGCGGSCTCKARCEAYLAGPIASVVEVRVDGAVLDPAAYRLEGTAYGPVLVRTDGDCWPECQDMNLPDTAEGTWSVQYVPGQALPRMGQIAAGELACEFARGCAGAGDCQLPAQLVSLSRNGVDVQVADPATLLADGLTGLPNVDLFIRAVNPARLTRQARVLSPDLQSDRVMFP